MPEQKGWIKIHRSISSHWISQKPEYLAAWVQILINVNHTTEKNLFGNKLLECKRGESLKSLDTWAQIFGSSWTKKKVRNFFKLLENDSMIVTNSERITTRLSVCKYDSYQSSGHADETQGKRKGHAEGTQRAPNKNVKNVKNVKKEEIKKRQVAPFVFVTDEELKKVEEKYGSKESVDWAIEKLNNYKGSNGKKYKSDYHVLIGWVYDEWEKNNGQLNQREPETKILPHEDQNSPLFGILPAGITEDGLRRMQENAGRG